MQGVETVPVVGTIAVRKWAASSGVPRRCRDYEVLQAEAMRVRAAVMVAFGAAKSNGPAGTRVARAPQIGVLPCRRSADPACGCRSLSTAGYPEVFLLPRYILTSTKAPGRQENS